MTRRTVIYLPDERLRKPTQSITEFNDELQILIDDMIETMHAEDGVGLAAPQIGISLKLAVIDDSRERNQPFCIINPEIIAREGEEFLAAGCLSIPGIYEKTPRATKITVRALDRHGNQSETVVEGHMAHIYQHEIDHLNGKLIVDYLSPLKQQLARKKMLKTIRQANDK